MAKPKRKPKKKSSDKSTTLTKLLIIQALLQLIKSAIELTDKLLDQQVEGVRSLCYKSITNEAICQVYDQYYFRYCFNYSADCNNCYRHKEKLNQIQSHYGGIKL